MHLKTIFAAMDSNPYIDLHTHQCYVTGNSTIRINSLMAGESIPDRPDKQFFSFGIHPYQLQMHKPAYLIQLFESMLQQKLPIAIGEVGLDKSIHVPMALQEEVFMYQIEKASAQRIPLIIHAVRSFQELIRLKRLFSADIPWILHGFDANEQTIKQLLTHDFYFSVGVALLHHKRKIFQSLHSIPIDRLFFETDDAAITIASIYTAAAQKLGVAPKDLTALICNNFNTLFPYESRKLAESD